MEVFQGVKGIVTHIIPFTLIYFSIGIPLQMCQLFLGQYSHIGTIRVWKISPIFIGVGLSMVISAALNAVSLTTAGSAALLYMKYSTYKELPYEFCESSPNESVYQRCYNSSSEVPKNFTCEWPDSLRYPAAYFYWKHFMDVEISEDGPENSEIKGEWMVAAAITWILVFLFVMYGYEKLIKIVPYQFGIQVVVIISGLYFILHEDADTGLRSFFDIDVEYLMEYENWDVALENVIKVQEIHTGMLILYGTFSQSKNKPGVDTCIMSGVWYISNIYACLVLYAMVGIIANVYNVSTKCVYIKDWITVFGVIPELILKSSMSHKLLNILFSIFFLLLVIQHSALLTLSVVENLKMAVPVFREYQVHLTATVCSTCFIISSPHFLQDSTYVNEIFYRGEGLCCTVLTLFFCVSVFWIYGIQRICDDVHFTRGYELAIYWKFSWKIMSVFYPTFAMYFLYDSLHSGRYIWKWLILLVVISPIIIMAVYQLIEAARIHDIRSLIRTSKSFGLTSDKLRRARRNFNPRKEIRHRTHFVKCKHNCLIQSNVLRKMVEFSEHRRKMFTMKNKDVSTTPVKDDEVTEKQHNDLINKILEQYF